MTPKEATSLAKSYVAELMKDEGITNIGLEEIEFDEKNSTWKITLGFSRSWNTKRGPVSTLAGDDSIKRAYRVITINSEDGQVISIKKPEYVSFN